MGQICDLNSGGLAPESVCEGKDEEDRPDVTQSLGSLASHVLSLDWKHLTYEWACYPCLDLLAA